ncbi:hypothetical protein ACHAWF_015584 [Thalassiosira exigua]
MYLLRINVGSDVLDKVSRYYDYHWSCQGGVMEQEVVDELPNSLRNSVSAYVNGAMVDSLPFLSRCDDATKQLLASHRFLQPRVFLPSDNIIQEGEKGFEMYFLRRGQAIVTSSAIRGPVRVLSRHEFFGESCLLESAVSNATVKACTYCECFSLSRDDFNSGIAGSPTEEQVRIDLKKLMLKTKSTNQRAVRNFSTHPKCVRLAVEPLRENSMPEKSSPALVLNHEGVPFLLWNSFLLLVCFYNAWMIPFRLAFDTSNKSITVDWVFDLFFLLDMGLNYRFVSFLHDGELVTDPKRISEHYVASGQFKTDLVSTLPLDLVAYYVLPEAPLVGECLRILRLFRLVRLGTLDKVFSFLGDRHIPLAGLRLAEFLSGVILIAHWAACGFFFIARLKSGRADCSDLDQAPALAKCLWNGTWIYKQIHDGKLPLDGGVTWQHYLRSFNWALPTLVVVVIGDVVPATSPETLYAFLLMAIGVTVNAAIVGNVANIVANLETDSSDFARRVDEIRQYCFKHHLTNELHQRVDDFTRFLWTSHSGSTNEDEFILRLPYTLQTEISTQTRTKLLLHCPFFDFFTGDIVKALAISMKPRQYCAGDIIVHAGDFGQSMFFLETGTVQVVPSDGSTVLATLAAGSFFGETSLFLKQKRSSSVCAVTFCDVFELEKSDLFDELRRREIDREHIMRLFVSAHKQNSRRNKAIQKNLNSSKQVGAKLNKLLVSVSDETTSTKRPVLDIFMPHSPLRFSVDVTCTALILYFSVSVSYRTAFREEEERRPLVFDVIADVFFICDVYMRSKYYAFTRNGSVCTESQMILQQYMTNGMMLDAVSCLSLLEIFAPRLPIRLLSLLRMLRIPSFLKKLREHLSLRGIRISLATDLLAKTILFYTIANHVVACIWFGIHRYIERRVRHTWGTSDCPWGSDAGSDDCLAKWNETLGEHNICNLYSMRDCYLRSLHFSLTTLSTVGYGDISPVTELETIYENIVVLLGACFLAGLIGAFGAYLSECDTLGFNAFKEKIHKLKKYMRYRRIPDDIQASILFFHHCRWKDSQTLDERETLRILPEPLQLDISFAVKQRVIRLVPILDSLPIIVQKRIAHAMLLQVYSLRDHPIIYSQGDIGWEIYFIVSGAVTISLPTDISELDVTGMANAASNKQKFDSIGLILGAGNHVGESCLCSKSGVRQETVTAMTSKVETYVLSKEDLDDICRLMGFEKGSQLRHALLTRNNRNWHSFEEIDNDAMDFDEASSTSHERQNSLRNLSFAWATPKPMSELTNTRANTRGSTIRHRRASQQRSRSSFSASPGSINLQLISDDHSNEERSTSSIV